jgi:hypothetical protein
VLPLSTNSTRNIIKAELVKPQSTTALGGNTTELPSNKDFIINENIKNSQIRIKK